MPAPIGVSRQIPAASSARWREPDIVHPAHDIIEKTSEKYLETYYTLTDEDL